MPIRAWYHAGMLTVALNCGQSDTGIRSINVVTLKVCLTGLG